MVLPTELAFLDGQPARANMPRIYVPLEPDLSPMPTVSIESFSSPQVRVLPNYEAMSRAAVEQVISCAKDVLASHGPFAMVLAGGNTPRRLYELLAGPYSSQINWNRVHLFWGDERYVPADDEASNFRVAREALIRHVPIPPDQVHRIPTDISPPAKAASTYEGTLRRFFEGRNDKYPFDLVLLGMGTDGHTASLFPEDAPHTTSSTDAPWVRAVTAPDRHTPRQRITLTMAALNQSRDAVFLVSGASKRDAAHAVLDASDETLPAAQVRPHRNLFWFLDREAYSPSTT